METARGEATAAGGQFKEMAAEARDTGALMKDRGLFAGQIEAKRKAGQKGKLANLRRSMAAGGASPQEIARAEAEASGGAQAGREDAIAASMASMQSGRQGLSQASGLTGQAMSASGMQAQLAGQQAALGMQGAGMQGQLAGQAGTMAGQAQGLGLQKDTSSGWYVRTRITGTNRPHADGIKFSQSTTTINAESDYATTRINWFTSWNDRCSIAGRCSPAECCTAGRSGGTWIDCHSKRCGGKCTKGAIATTTVDGTG